MMMHRLAIAALALFLACPIASADVIVRVQVVDEIPAAAPATQPASAPVNAQPLDKGVSIEALATPEGNFLARTRVGDRTIELKGTLKRLENDRYRVRLGFSDRAPGQVQEISTNADVPPGEPKAVAGLMGAAGQRTVVLTIADEPAK